MAIGEIKQKRLHLKQQNANFTLVMERMPQGILPNTPSMVPRVSVWRSSRLLAQVFKEDNGVFRLSFNRTDIDDFGKWKQDISWDELQKAKSEMGFGDKFAVEVFPADKDVVNVANMRHLWVLPEPLAFGWVKEGQKKE